MVTSYSRAITGYGRAISSYGRPITSYGRVLHGFCCNRGVPKSIDPDDEARQTSLDYSCKNDWMVIVQMVATGIYLTTKPGRDAR